MYALHLTLLALSACTLAAVGASGALAPRSGRDANTLQLLSFVVGGALVIGNAACLLPGTPAWYSVAVVTATAGGIMWLCVSLLAAMRARTSARAARPTGQAHWSAGRTPIATPLTTALPTGDQAAQQTYPRLRLIADSTPDSIVDVTTGRPVVTADMIHAAGPHGSRSVSGTGIYVAANLDSYIPGRAPQRRHGAEVVAGALRPVQAAPVAAPGTPAAVAAHARAARTYADAPVRRSRIRSTL